MLFFDIHVENNFLVGIKDGVIPRDWSISISWSYTILDTYKEMTFCKYIKKQHGPHIP